MCHQMVMQIEQNAHNSIDRDQLDLNMIISSIELQVVGVEHLLVYDPLNLNEKCPQ